MASSGRATNSKSRRYLLSCLFFDFFGKSCLVYFEEPHSSYLSKCNTRCIVIFVLTVHSSIIFSSVVAKSCQLDRKATFVLGRRGITGTPREMRGAAISFNSPIFLFWVSP